MSSNASLRLLTEHSQYKLFEGSYGAFQAFRNNIGTLIINWLDGFHLQTQEKVKLDVLTWKRKHEGTYSENEFKEKCAEFIQQGVQRYKTTFAKIDEEYKKFAAHDDSTDLTIEECKEWAHLIDKAQDQHLHQLKKDKSATALDKNVKISNEIETFIHGLKYAVENREKVKFV
jgi:hypothetical protein